MPFTGASCAKAGGVVTDSVPVTASAPIATVANRVRANPAFGTIAMKLCSDPVCLTNSYARFTQIKACLRPRTES